MHYFKKMLLKKKPEKNPENDPVESVRGWILFRYLQGKIKPVLNNRFCSNN